MHYHINVLRYFFPRTYGCIFFMIIINERENTKIRYEESNLYTLSSILRKWKRIFARKINRVIVLINGNNANRIRLSTSSMSAFIFYDLGSNSLKLTSS